MKGNPEIITGPRSEDSYPQRSEDAPGALPRVPASRAAAAPLPNGRRRFQAVAAAYRLQIDCANDTIVQGVGRIPGISRAVQFQNSLFETDDPELIAAIERSKSYGLGKAVWDADKFRQAAEDKQYESFVAQVNSNPRLKERLSVDPRLKDFPVEAPPPAA